MFDILRQEKLESNGETAEDQWKCQQMVSMCLMLFRLLRSGHYYEPEQ